MSKYVPFVRIHRKDGDLDVFEDGKPWYDTYNEANSVGWAIRADMLQVDMYRDPTVFVLDG